MVTNSIVETRKSTQYALVVVVVLIAKLCPTLTAPWTITHQAPLPWDFPGNNTGVGFHFLFQGICTGEPFKDLRISGTKYY